MKQVISRYEWAEMSTTLNVLITSSLLLFILIMTGCAIVGSTVGEDKRIIFSSSESGHGSFASDGFTINYQYDLKGNDLVLKGDITGGWNVASLDVRLLLLDAEGKVLFQKLIYISGYRVAEILQQQKQFHSVVPLTLGTTGFSFILATEERMVQP